LTQFRDSHLGILGEKSHLDHIKYISKRPTKNPESKGESIVEYKLGKITKGCGVHITNYVTKFVY